MRVETPWLHPPDDLAAAVLDACGLTVAINVGHALDRGVCDRPLVAAGVEHHRWVGSTTRLSRCRWQGGCGRAADYRVTSIFGSWWVCNRHFIPAEKALRSLYSDTVRLRPERSERPVTRAEALRG
jgi:hypothetical protein